MRLIAALIVLGLILLGLNYFPTANWKTFNNKYFSIDLPNNWVDDSTPGGIITYLNYDIKKASGTDFNPQIDKGLLKIEVYEIPAENFTTIEQHYSNNTVVKLDAQPTKTRIDNQEALKFAVVGDYFYVKHPTKPVVLSINFQLDFNNYRSLENQILSTIKFTD